MRFEIGDVVRYTIRSSAGSVLATRVGTVVRCPPWRDHEWQTVYVDFGVINAIDVAAPAPTTIWGCGRGEGLELVYSADDPT